MFSPETIRQLAGFFGATAIMAGAFGSHALQSNPKVDAFKTGANYQLIHSLALLCISQQSKPNGTAALLFSLGNVLFSGSIYALVLTKLRVGIVTPIGGLCYVAGWASLFLQ
jgi:uncharacterized membrane protein YgdD (TMEM256/DUF423 family)